jgi:hypothetical protein
MEGHVVSLLLGGVHYSGAARTGLNKGDVLKRALAACEDASVTKSIVRAFHVPAVRVGEGMERKGQRQKLSVSTVSIFIPFGGAHVAT